MNLSNTFPRRLRYVAAGLAAAGAGTVLTVGTATAFEVPCDPDDPGPIVELCETPMLSPLPPDLDLGDLDGEEDSPIVTLPPGVSIPLPGDDDDGPTITIPPGLSIPLPGDDDDGPTITIPPGVSIPIPDGDDPPADAPADPPAEDPADTPSDAPAEDPADTPSDAPADPPAGTTGPPAGDGQGPAPETPGQSGLLLPAVAIREAVVSCDGSVRVVYDTTADPALSVDAEHVVSVSPLVVPDVAMTRRLVQQPLTGQFSAEIAAPADDYRVFVLVDFEPGNPDGVLLADELTATAPTDCPAG